MGNKIFLRGEFMNILLKKKILERGLPQIAVARELGVADSYLSKVVNGWVTPKNQLKEKIAHALHCSVEEIFPMEQTQKVIKRDR
jgi:transcriptional regulator with XRE-family HTH domain